MGWRHYTKNRMLPDAVLMRQPPIMSDLQTAPDYIDHIHVRLFAAANL